MERLQVRWNVVRSLVSSVVRSVVTSQTFLASAVTGASREAGASLLTASSFQVMYLACSREAPACLEARPTAVLQYN